MFKRQAKIDLFYNIRLWNFIWKFVKAYDALDGEFTFRWTCFREYRGLLLELELVFAYDLIFSIV